jgi:hypothetical protein
MSKLPSFVAIKKAVKKVTAKLFTKNTVTFLLFFILATLFWLMQTIGTKKDITVEIPVKYKGIPQNYVISENLPTEINIIVKDEGKELLDYYWFDRPDSVEINLSGKFQSGGGTINYQVELLRNELYPTMPKSAQIIGFIPEYIQINYDMLAEKTLPVKLHGDYSLAQQYILSDSISIQPSQIIAYGTQSVLDSIDYVNITPFSRLLLTSTTTFTENLEPIPAVRFNVQQVEVSIPVEITTEKNIKISVVPIHFPQGITLRTFPAAVTATFSVGISKFSKIMPQDISVGIDYETLKTVTGNKYPLQITSFNPDIRNLRITPQEVEILLEKND